MSVFSHRFFRAAATATGAVTAASVAWTTPTLHQRWSADGTLLTASSAPRVWPTAAFASAMRVCERFSKAEFDTLIQVDGTPLSLASIGCRCMLQRCDYERARAYGFGLYVDLTSPAATLAKRNDGGPRATLEDVLRASGPKALVLRMARDVAGKHVAKGFDRSLIGRVRRYDGKRNGPGKRGLKTLTTVFRNRTELKKGTEVRFVVGQDSSVRIFVDGKLDKALPPGSTAVASALIAMYLDDSSVIPSLRNATLDSITPR